MGKGNDRRNNMFTRLNLKNATLPQVNLKEEVLSKLPSEMPQSAKRDVVAFAYRCVLQIAHTRDVIRRIRTVAPEYEEQVKAVFDWIRREPYLRRIHRAVHEMAYSGIKDRRFYAKKWAVHIRDISQALKSISPPDRRKIQRASNRMAFAPPLCRKSMDVMIEQVIMPYAKKLADYRLRFIAQYDPAKSKRDLAGELIEEGLRATYHYDYMSDELELMNYVRRCMHNHMVRIINHNTTQSRSRLLKVDNDERIYMTTTMSLDTVTSEGDDDGCGFHEFLTKEKSDHDHQRDAAAVLESAFSSLSPEITFSFLLGKGEASSEGFDNYLRDEGIRIRKDDVVERTKHALKYHGYKWDAFRSNVRNLLEKPTAEQYFMN